MKVLNYTVFNILLIFNVIVSHLSKVDYPIWHLPSPNGRIAFVDNSLIPILCLFFWSYRRLSWCPSLDLQIIRLLCLVVMWKLWYDREFQVAGSVSWFKRLISTERAVYLPPFDAYLICRWEIKGIFVSWRQISRDNLCHIYFLSTLLMVLRIIPFPAIQLVLWSCEIPSR